MRVLIVDDSPQAIAVARARLAREGLEVAWAQDGRSGIDAARADGPDLILLDVDMPGLSGFETCQALKEDPELAMIPVIFVTGSRDSKDKVKGLDLGAVDYVTKPFDPFELRARVRAALRTKRLQDMLIEHAQLDPLTELPNRRALQSRLEQEWQRRERYGGALGVIMTDLDRFKSVNDRHGHQAGDRVLQAFAATIRGQCRQSDLPARYGGEEFAILCPQQDLAGTSALAERCREATERMRVAVEKKTLEVTASFGVATAEGASDPDALVAAADEALYAAKEAGRNRVRASGQTVGSGA